MKDYLWKNDGSSALMPCTTEEEKWTALGRKVGEMEKGDIVFHDSYGFLEVVLVTDKKATVEMVQKGKPEQMDVDLSSLELITPVDFRFDQHR